jgi:hypothetical protein
MDFGVVKGERIVPVFSVSGPDDQPLLVISTEQVPAEGLHSLPTTTHPGF